jgi:gamma-glutamyltranspeptidase
MGHTVQVLQSGSGEFSRFGNVQAISVDAESGLMTGVADPRADGRARGF